MQRWNRRSIRLRGYDYSRSGYYFVTICTEGKEKSFGRIEKNSVALNDFGKIAQNEWIKTTQIRAYVQLDMFIIMPDHMHGILVIVHDGRQYRGMVQTNVGATGPVAPTIINPISHDHIKYNPISTDHTTILHTCLFYDIFLSI